MLRIPRRSNFLPGVGVVACSAAATPTSGTAEGEGSRFDSESIAGGERLDLRGAPLLRRRGFFEAHVAGLSLPAPTPRRDALGEVRKSRCDEFHEAHQAIGPGDRYAVPNRPDAGTEPSKNRRSLVVIPGADFAAACFAMGPGESPIDVRFTDSLLETIPTRAQE